MEYLTYKELWAVNPRAARALLRLDYQKTGSFSQTARNFKTDRHIVKKWVLRDNLESQKPIPRNQPNRLDRQKERLIIKIRDVSGFGPKRIHYYLKRQLGMIIGKSTIAKYLKKHGKTKKRLKRIQPKAFDWKSLPIFSTSQADTKEILDQPVFAKEEQGLYLAKGLPPYQFSIFFPRIEAKFICFSYENTKKAALNFFEYVFDHLKNHQVLEGEKVFVQTDWGPENGGFQTNSLKEFDKSLADLHITHWHSRKRSSFRNLKDFMIKAWEWVYYYNIDRSHDTLKGGTPYEELLKYFPKAPKSLLALPPIILDDTITLYGGSEVYGQYTAFQ